MKKGTYYLRRRAARAKRIERKHISDYLTEYVYQSYDPGAEGAIGSGSWAPWEKPAETKAGITERVTAWVRSAIEWILDR